MEDLTIIGLILVIAAIVFIPLAFLTCFFPMIILIILGIILIVLGETERPSYQHNYPQSTSYPTYMLNNHTIHPHTLPHYIHAPLAECLFHLFIGTTDGIVIIVVHTSR